MGSLATQVAVLIIAIVFQRVNGASMKATPEEINNRETITVSWEGVSYPMAGDWIAIYSPPSSSNENWIMWQYASKSPTWQGGNGRYSLRTCYKLRYVGCYNEFVVHLLVLITVCSLEFLLVNFRTDYEFRYLREYTWFTAAVRSTF